MRSFQTVLAILMAAMVNMALATPGIHATALILAATLVNSVICSGFQHSVLEARQSVLAALGHAKPSRLLQHQTNYTAGCFNNSTFPHAGNENSTLVPWTALANQDDLDSEMGLFYTFTAICKKISATILTRNIPYTHCEPDIYTNGTYGIMAQLMYLGPQDIYDMRSSYDYCMGVMSLTMDCDYGGLFEELHFWYGLSNNSQFWNVQARPIRGPCPDCIGGLLAGAD